MIDPYMQGNITASTIYRDKRMNERVCDMNGMNDRYERVYE